MAKIAKTTPKIYWMIQKILYWKIFLKMVQNGPIRKVITIKVIFEDLFIFSPAVGHPCWTLRKFQKIFQKKTWWSFYRDCCNRSTWYSILRMFLTLSTHSDKFSPSSRVLHTFFYKKLYAKIVFLVIFSRLLS